MSKHLTFLHVVHVLEPVLSLAHRDYWQCFEQLIQHDTYGRWVFFISLLSALAVDNTVRVHLCFLLAFDWSPSELKIEPTIFGLHLKATSGHNVLSVQRLSSVSLAVQQTAACSKIITSQGRGRFFIRLMLMRRTLGNVVKHLLHTNRVMEVSEQHNRDENLNSVLWIMPLIF